MPRPPINLVGQRFGQLVAVAIEAASPGDKHARFLCRCDCGETAILRGSHLRSGRAVSCGCAGYRRDADAHRKARRKVPARRRRAIAKMGARARTE